MIGNGNPVLPGIAGCENEVASLLIQPALVEVFAEQFDPLRPTQIPRQFHATASTSSRTRCSRIIEGLGWSKKNALTASLTLARNSSHVSPWVKMSYERHSPTNPPSASWVMLKKISLYETWQGDAQETSGPLTALARRGVLEFTRRRPGSKQSRPALRSPASPRKYGVATSSTWQRR